MDLTKQKADELIAGYMSKKNKEIKGGELIVIDSLTVETSFGWVFYIDSEEYVRTGDFTKKIVPNFPLIVTKNKGKIIPIITYSKIEPTLLIFESLYNKGKEDDFLLELKSHGML